MDDRSVLQRCLTLLIRESQINNDSYQNTELIETVLESIRGENGSSSYNGQKPLKKLKEYILELAKEPKENIEVEVIMPQVKLILENEENLYEVIKQSIEQEYSEATIKRVIVSLAKSLNTFYREQKATDIISRAAYELKFNRDKVPDMATYLGELITQIEPYQSKAGNKDPAILEEADFSNEDSIKGLFDQVKKESTQRGILRTGWKDLNKMLQGGFRPGEFWVIPALQHKYKTGLTLSLFTQIALFNKPTLKKDNKKPLLVRFGFEDSNINSTSFIYDYLKGDPEKINDSDHTSQYVISALTLNGFYVKFIRVDPTLWSYRDILNKIVDLEAEGYEIKLCLFDYLSLIPTTGCITGPAGVDRRDQFRRVKNFFQARDTVVITPHQLSTEAKALIRQGVPEHSFVKEVAEKGYFEGSKQLDQEVDGELYLHLFRVKGKGTFISLQRGKHRIPTNIEDSDKYVLYKFPNINTPIPHDIDTEKSIGLRSISEIKGGGNALDELL